MGELLIDFTSVGKSSSGMNIFEQNPGGAPANVASCVARLGGKAAFIGKVGDDMHGRFLKETSISEDVLSKIVKLNKIARRRGQTLAQMALSWVYSKEGVTSVLIGASKPEQIEENVKMLDNISFTETELREIDEIVL